MERYFTSAGNMELTDGIAEALLRTVVKNALILVDEPDNYEARAEVMWAGSLSHNGLTGCGNGGDDFATHRIEHEISGMFDVAHGAGLAAIWGSWARYVLDDCLTRFKKFATNVWNIEDSGDDREIALEGISRTEDFFKSIGMPISLKDFGFELTDEVIDELAEKIAKKLEQSIKLNEDNKEQASDKKQRSGGGWLKLNLPTENENIQNGQSLPNEEVIELEPKAKPKIDIQISSENNEISMLKENFNKNKNPEIALKIARKCYQDKRYSDTIKWALSANNLDSSIEESWVMFAKAKYMLKQKDDALRALEEYNKNKNKLEINELINKIKSDTL